MDGRINNSEKTGLRKLTEDELERLAGGADDGYPFACPRCGNTKYFCYYFGSKRVAYQCERCGCRFWQNGTEKPYEVDDCD